MAYKDPLTGEIKSDGTRAISITDLKPLTIRGDSTNIDVSKLTAPGPMNIYKPTNIETAPAISPDTIKDVIAPSAPEFIPLPATEKKLPVALQDESVISNIPSIKSFIREDKNNTMRSIVSVESDNMPYRPTNRHSRVARALGVGVRPSMKRVRLSR